MVNRKPSEYLRKPLFTAAPLIDTSSRANAIAGITTLSSGSATVVVSTSSVKSDSLILLGQVGYANVGSGAARPIEVKTISDTGYFTLGVADGQAMARDTLLHWMLLDKA